VGLDGWPSGLRRTPGKRESITPTSGILLDFPYDGAAIRLIARRGKRQESALNCPRNCPRICPSSAVEARLIPMGARLPPYPGRVAPGRNGVR
jgi:hypothetical protein